MEPGHAGHRIDGLSKGVRRARPVRIRGSYASRALDLRQHPEDWAKDRYDWAAVGLLLLAVVAAIAVVAELGGSKLAALIVAMVVGYSGSLVRRPLAARFRARRRT